MSTVLYAKSTQDLLSQLKNNLEIEVVGGCTQITKLPEKVVSTHGIKELSYIDRHERFIDVGPGTTLAELLAVGQNHLPAVLYEALKSIANPMIRNMATVGGNICNPNYRLTLFAPLMALEAKLEYKNQTETIIEPIQNFKGIPEGFILSNVRIPIVDAEVSIFRRIGPENRITAQSAAYAFIANTEKNILVDIKLAFAGFCTFSSKEIENFLIGHRLPLSQKDIDQIQERIAQELDNQEDAESMTMVGRKQFLNLTRYSFEQLT